MRRFSLWLPSPAPLLRRRGQTTRPTRPYINDVYLKHHFAETKIVNGLGDAGAVGIAMLPPAKYQQLKERVDLDFAYTNKTQFAAGDEPVSLDLHVKNVKTLIVKVFEINTQNFYRSTMAARSTPTSTWTAWWPMRRRRTNTTTSPPLRRVTAALRVSPALTKPGVYVIDFIGNGKSSRGADPQGALRYLVRTGTAGHVFTVLDEQEPARSTTPRSGWPATSTRRTKTARSPCPSPTTRGGSRSSSRTAAFSSLDHFPARGENYRWRPASTSTANRCSAGAKAEVVVRPGLSVSTARPSR